jgi:hypothetical protein
LHFISKNGFFVIKLDLDVYSQARIQTFLNIHCGGMSKIHFLFFFFILTGCLTILSPLEAFLWNCCEPLDISAEARVAYYHPCSKRVRRIYHDGWADYQFEVSKGFGRNLRVWTGVSGFSRRGQSIGFHNRTTLQLIPVYLGLRYYYPLLCNVDVFVGGAACYSYLRIRDHSDFVHKHTRREEWGGVVQSGLSYNFCGWGVVSVFFDYFFQRFHFHKRSERGSFYGSNFYYDDRFIYRRSLNMDGYKVGVGLGVKF